MFEEHEGKSYSVSKVTFGDEPKDEEIYGGYNGKRKFISDKKRKS